MKRLCLSLLFLSQFCLAGGPLNVAGVNGFQPGLAGTPITWANGRINYYTDQGSLSPVLNSAAADQFVADAFSRWSSISTGAVTATRVGALDEDVNGTNVISVNGVLTVPADVRPDSAKPLAIIYDTDGRVFDAIFGTGAGTPEMCSTNSVFVLIDKIGDDAHLAHAMVVINGNCAQTADGLSLFRYRLVRALGRVLGLDHSQLNENVISGSPSPTLEDYAGYPLMHPLGLLCTENGCQSDADQPRMDDRAALSRMYPVTAANLPDFPGKHVLHDETARISGSVRFPPWNGTPGQGMQGVNVVARLIDPVTSRVSRRFAASSVSGFLFQGMAGTPIFGYNNMLGQPLDRFGSNDPALEGFFDLTGLEVPAGYSQATYELSVEAISQLYSDSIAVGPYKTGPVEISGTFAPIRVTVARGGEVTQDIVMQGAASELQDQYETQTFASPSPLPASGDWFGSLSGYADEDYYYFNARASRSYTLDVIALDENRHPVSTKARPILGLWHQSDAGDSPRDRANYFNSADPGKTRLQGTLVNDGVYKIGIIDAREDGRPDFLYSARLLYADDIAPFRSSVNGGTAVTVNGIGFAPVMQVQVGSTIVSANVIGPDRIVFTAPPLPDGIYSVLVTDPANGAISEIEHVLRVGAADARIVLLSGSNPQVPVGTQAPNPMRVQVVDSDSGDPVVGATVNFSAPSSAAIAGCSQSPCTILTDQTGVASVYIIVRAEGASIISASLPDGNSVSTTVNGIAALLEITLGQPSVYVSAGVNATIVPQATVVASGLPVPNKVVNFLLNSGTATISPTSASTNGNGVATTSITVSGITKDVNISACVAPANNPCRTLLIHPVAPNSVTVQKASGDLQMIDVGSSFAPLSVRVTDLAGNPVAGMPVLFMTDIYRTGSDTVRVQYGEVIISTRDEPVILGTSWTRVSTDASGYATLNLNSIGSQPVQVVVRAVAGNSVASLFLQSIWGSPAGETQTINAGASQTLTFPVIADTVSLQRPSRLFFPVVVAPQAASNESGEDPPENAAEPTEKPTKNSRHIQSKARAVSTQLH